MQQATGKVFEMFTREGNLGRSEADVEFRYPHEMAHAQIHLAG